MDFTYGATELYIPAYTCMKKCVVIILNTFKKLGRCCNLCKIYIPYLINSIIGVACIFVEQLFTYFPFIAKCCCMNECL